jgi:hypothetical protein
MTFMDIVPRIEYNLHSGLLLVCVNPIILMVNPHICMLGGHTILSLISKIKSFLNRPVTAMTAAGIYLTV